MNHNKVIWYEGLFLQPHHLQQQERYFEHFVLSRLFASGGYHWGLTALKLNQDLLQVGQFSLEQCCGIFPDGTLFNIPETDNAPLALNIPSTAAETLVQLVLPLKRAGVPEIAEQEKRARYYIQDCEVGDYQQSQAGHESIQIGKLNLQLKLGSDGLKGYSAVPIARIQAINSDQKIVLDEHFFPPCLKCHALPNLIKLIEQILILLQHRGEVLRDRLASPDQASTSELIDFLFLQMCNRYEPQFMHLLQKTFLHPEELYKTLIQLTGDLAVFTQHNHRIGQVIAYQHTNLSQTFTPLVNTIKKAFTLILEQAAVPLNLEKRQQGMWVAAIIEKNLSQEAKFILGVHASMSQALLRQRFIAQSKVAGVEDIRTLMSRALPGIEIQALTRVPAQIPRRANFVYFAFNQQDKYWQQLEKSSGLAVHVAGNFADLELELWAIKDK